MLDILIELAPAKTFLRSWSCSSHRKNRIFPRTPLACWRGAPPARWPSEPPVAHAARGLPRAALRAPAPQACSLALFKNTQPIIRTVQLDKLNNKGLHNKVSKTLNQVNAVAATPRPTADAADAADAMHADLLEPLAAAECLLAPVATAALLLLLPWLVLLLTPLAPPLPLTLLATLPLTLPMRRAPANPHPRDPREPSCSEGLECRVNFDALLSSDLYCECRAEHWGSRWRRV